MNNYCDSSGSCKVVGFEIYGLDNLTEKVCAWLKENPTVNIWDIVWDINNNGISYARIYYNGKWTFQK